MIAANDTTLINTHAQLQSNSIDRSSSSSSSTIDESDTDDDDQSSTSQRYGTAGSEFFDKIRYVPQTDPLFMIALNRPIGDSRKTKSYYRREDQLIEKFNNDRQLLLNDDREQCTTVSDDDGNVGCRAKQLALITLCINVSLMIAKVLAVYLSGSLSIISSLVDSTVDVTSGLAIWLTSRAMRHHHAQLYPRGRSRLEPLCIIVISVIMAMSSVQIVKEAAESILLGEANPDVNWWTFSIMSSTIVIKFILFIVCRMHKGDVSIAVLAQDHRNDCISNAVAVLCAILADRYWRYLDPIGALIVSAYIAITWFLTGKEHLIMMSGRSANAELISRIANICIEHDPRIDRINYLYVYHFGIKLLVEVSIVLNDDSLPLKSTSDISNRLKMNIERLAEVERAFVNCDCRTTLHDQFIHADEMAMCKQMIV